MPFIVTKESGNKARIGCNEDTNMDRRKIPRGPGTKYPNSGRKPVPVTEEMLDEIRRMASLGMYKEQIWRALGFSRTTMNRKIQQVPELLEAFEEGKAMGVHNVANALMECALEKDVQAIKFYLKAKGGWRENEAEQITSATLPTINVNFVKPKDDDD